MSRRYGENVPCGSCTACCTHLHLHAEIQPEELSAFPEAVKNDTIAHGWRLPKKDNGECVHLVGGQCSIYERRPRACRDFDCRAYFFWMHPFVRYNADFVKTVLSMWDDWELDTPEDVDHMLAITRAVKEAITEQTSAGRPLGGLSFMVSIVKLYNRYRGGAHVFRERVGYDGAREVARANDRTLRSHLMHMLDHSVWVSESPSTPPSLMDMISLGDAVDEVAESIRTGWEKEGFMVSP
jgi:Fe-S-cluster containining protein